MRQAKLTKRIKTIADLLIRDSNLTLASVLQEQDPDFSILIYLDPKGKVVVNTASNDPLTLISMLEIAKSKVVNSTLEAENDSQGPLSNV